MTLASIYKSVLRCIKQVLHSGQSESFSPQDNDRTYHLNLLLLVSIVASLTFALFNSFWGEINLVRCALGVTVFNVGMIWLQAKGLQYASRKITTASYPLFCFLLIYYGQGAIKGEYAFYLMIALSVLFFRSLQRQISMIGFVFLFYLASQLVLYFEFDAIGGIQAVISNCIVFLSISFGLVLITNSFIQQIIDANRKNRQLLKELAYSNEELKRLNYMVSHDLRTPLRQIVSFSKLAQVSTQQGETSSSTEYMELIEHSARELYNMTENLLSLAHLDQNQLKTEPILVEGIFLKMEKQFSKTSGEETIQIKTAAHSLQMNGSPILLQMLLQNLVENGIKYNESTAKVIWLEAKETEHETCIYVRDNGIGIAEDDQDKIFAVFHRLDPHKYQGTGLGLAIAKKIMDIHGGKIMVASSTEGSIFVLRFPKQPQEDISHDAEAQQQALPLKMLYQLSKQGRAIF